MYSEDIYANHLTDHSVLIIYCAVFSIMAVGIMLKLVFNSADKEYKYTDN